MPTTDRTPELLNELARRFEWHGTNIYASKNLQNASPLYENLSLAVSKDGEVLSLVTDADRAQQISNLLFGAVHYLLLSGLAHPVTNFYHSLTPCTSPPDEAYPYFRDFCLNHADEIRQLVTTRRVQTNEVQRAACLLPAFELIAQQSDEHPVGLIEIGASAGFHLRFDRYAYDYGPVGHTTVDGAALTLHCAVKSKQTPSIPFNPPRVSYRVGIDLMPIDTNDNDALRWLRGLIWPEHVDRAEAMSKAIQVARQNPVTMVQGNAAELLPEVLDSVPNNVIPCVYHSYTLNQMSGDVRERILNQLKRYGQKRNFYQVSLEWYSGQTQPQLELVIYQNGHVSSQILAYCESHGREIEWLVED